MWGKFLAFKNGPVTFLLYRSLKVNKKGISDIFVLLFEMTFSHISCILLKSPKGIGKIS